MQVSMLFGDLTIQDVVEDILMWVPLRRGALDAVTHASSSLRQTSSCLLAYRSAFFVCKGGVPCARSPCNDAHGNAALQDCG